MCPLCAKSGKRSESRNRLTKQPISLASVHSASQKVALPPNDLERKMRARTVLLGNDVRDTWYQEAEMEGLGAAVLAMED